MFDEVPIPPEYDRGDLNASWWRRNSIAGIAVATLGVALFNAWNWYVFRQQDEAIDAVGNTVIAIILAYIHKKRKNAQRYLDASRRVDDESGPHAMEIQARH
jgi:predicted negative regulator of RcsB-dependent stress response